jgi:hypothetical protein
MDESGSSWFLDQVCLSAEAVPSHSRDDEEKTAGLSPTIALAWPRSGVGVLCREFEAANFTTLVYSVLLIVGKSVLKMTETVTK